MHAKGERGRERERGKGPEKERERERMLPTFSNDAITLPLRFKAK